MTCKCDRGIASCFYCFDGEYSTATEARCTLCHRVGTVHARDGFLCPDCLPDTATYYSGPERYDDDDPVTKEYRILGDWD